MRTYRNSNTEILEQKKPTSYKPSETYLYLLGLNLAHPVTGDTAFTISLLIGADHYQEIVENEIIRGKGPTAVRSKIGYLQPGSVSDAPARNNKGPAENILNVIVCRKKTHFSASEAFTV